MGRVAAPDPTIEKIDIRTAGRFCASSASRPEARAPAGVANTSKCRSITRRYERCGGASHGAPPLPNDKSERRNVPARAGSAPNNHENLSKPLESPRSRGAREVARVKAREGARGRTPLRDGTLRQAPAVRLRQVRSSDGRPGSDSARHFRKHQDLRAVQHRCNAENRRVRDERHRRRRFVSDGGESRSWTVFAQLARVVVRLRAIAVARRPIGLAWRRIWICWGFRTWNETYR